MKSTSRVTAFRKKHDKALLYLGVYLILGAVGGLYSAFFPLASIGCGSICYPDPLTVLLLLTPYPYLQTILLSVLSGIPIVSFFNVFGVLNTLLFQTAAVMSGGLLFVIGMVLVVKR